MTAGAFPRWTGGASCAPVASSPRAGLRSSVSSSGLLLRNPDGPGFCEVQRTAAAAAEYSAPDPVRVERAQLPPRPRTSGADASPHAHAPPAEPPREPLRAAPPPAPAQPAQPWEQSVHEGLSWAVSSREASVKGGVRGATPAGATTAAAVAAR